MPGIYVKTDGMRTSSARLRMSSNTIAVCAGTANSIKGTFPFSDDISREFDRAISRSVEQLYITRSRVSNLASAIEEAAALYEETEKKNAVGFPFAFSGIGGLLHHLIGGNTGGGLWEGSVGGSVISGSVSGSGALLGLLYSGTASGSLLNYSASGKVTSGMEIDEDGNISRLGLGVEGDAKVNLAEGTLSGNFGKLSGTLSGSVGNVYAKGEVGATLVQNGYLAPALYAGVSAGASALSGSANLKYGDDDFNRFVNASGEVLSAKASAKGAAGVITVEGKDGTKSTHVGVQGEVAAEAYLAQGTVSGGFDFFGFKVSVGVTGKAGGAGVKAGGSATTGGVSGTIGAGLGVGADVSLSVDWSQFDPSRAWEAAVDAGEAVGEFVSEAGEAVGEFAENTGEFFGEVGESVSNFFSGLW